MTKKELIKTLKELEEVNEDFDKEEELIDTLEKNLNFKNEEQHQYWLGVLFSYKFWEDFEELTLSIINQRKKTNTLPQKAIIKNGLLVAKSYKKMPSCESMELEQIIEEFISIYLTDNHDKNIKGFEWETHNNDIKVTNIIWEK